jgi:hypothetical protein
MTWWSRRARDAIGAIATDIGMLRADFVPPVRGGLRASV